MIPISEDLGEEIQSDSQNVKPVVKAWMSDIRYLENVKTYTSSHTYNKQILDRSPNVYVRFDKTDYNVSTQTRNCLLANDGAGKIIVQMPSHGLSAGAAICFSSDGSMPSEIGVGDLKTKYTYYVQNPAGGASAHYFYLNTSRANALAGDLGSRVSVAGTSGATGIPVTISIANPAVFTTSGAHGYSNGDAVVVKSFSSPSPSGLTMTVDSPLTVYYVQNATTTTFNLNTSASNAVLNSLEGRVATTGSSSTKYVYAVHKGTSQTYGGHRVKDHGALGLDIAYGASTAGAPVYTSDFGTTFQSRSITDKAIEIIEENRLVDMFERDPIGTKVCTIELTPSPFTAAAIFTCANHGLSVGDPLVLNTTGVLPTLQYFNSAVWATVNPNEILYVNTVTSANTFTLRRYRYNYYEIDTPLRALAPQSGVHSFSIIKDIGNFNSTGSDSYNQDMEYYSWRPSYKTNIYTGRAYSVPDAAYEGAIWWAGGADFFETNPAYVTTNLRCLDHFVDWRQPELEGNGAIVRYIDENNYIYCRGLQSTSTNSIAIYKVVDGITTLAGGVNSTYLNDSNYYRFQADYNTFTIYNMGEFEPINTTNPVSTILSVYIDDPIFRTENATSVGLISFSMFELYGIAPYDPKLMAYYFAAYGYNYIIGSHYFNSAEYCYASTALPLNKTAQFQTLNNQSNFTYSFLFDKVSFPASNQTIFWLGNNARNTAIKITSFLFGDQELLRVRVFNTAGTQYILDSTPDPLTYGQMNHIAIIKNGTRLSLFIDGEENAYITLPSNFVMRDIVTGNTPYLVFGGGYDSGISGESGYQLLTGKISEFAVFDYAFNQDDIDSLYYSIENEATLNASTSDNYYNAECIIDGIQEETYLYAFANMQNYLGRTIKTNNYSYVVNPVFDDNVFSNIEDNYGWMSRVQSDFSGIFDYQEDFVKVSFDSIRCNKIFISTGYMNGGIYTFDYFITKSDNTIIEGAKGFDTFEDKSYTYITSSDLGLEDNEYLDIIAIKIIPTSTVNAYDYAHIYTINPIWEVDLSDYVVSFNIDKIRDNFDASLPIGATAANNGSISFDNTDLVFNPYGNTLYGDYVNPDTKFFIYLKHEISKTQQTEIIPLAEEMYADTWNFDTSSMTADVQIRDYSKFLQEENIKGYISQGLCAGRSIRDIMLSSGFPARKIFYYDKFYETIFFDDPVLFIPFFEGQNEIDASNLSTGTMAFSDECQYVYALDTSPSLGKSGSSIVYSDILSAQDDSERISDDLAIKTFNSVYRTGSYNPNGDLVLYKYSDNARWNEAGSGTSFSGAYYVRDPDDLSAGTYYTLAAYQGVSDKRGIKVEVQKSVSDNTKLIFRLSAINFSGTSYSTVSNPVPISQSHLIHVTIPTATSLKFYLDGEIVGTINPTNIYVPSPSEFVISTQGDTFVSNFSYFADVLSAERIRQHYEVSFFSIIPTFKYLYAKDSTYWDAMLTIATADLGMFYIDEYGNFRYEYRNALHQEGNSRYQTSQYTFADDVNIISGSVTSEVQTNKINLKVNKTTFNASESGALWSAESNESLAITSVVSNVTPNSSSIQLKNTSNPLLLPSGYVKINNEIIKYNSIVNNTLTNIQRAQFGTQVGWHLPGDRAREARFYNVDYSDSPAVVVYYPFLTTELFDETATIDYYAVNAFSAQIVVSANDPGPTSYIEDGVEYYYFQDRAKTNYIVLEGTNPLNGDSNFFRVAGVPTVTQQSKETVTSYSAEIESNIRKYRLKELDIDNEFISNKIYAQIVADHIIGYFADPVRILNVEILGVPQLQLGDLVTIEKFDDIGIANTDFWTIQSTISYDGGIQQSLMLREYSATIDPPELLFTEDGGSEFSIL
jgi:hypothetical protein